MLRRDLASSGKSEAGERDLVCSPAAEANPFALFADGTAKRSFGAKVASAAPSPLALFLAPFRA
jgi:hypothetical protein